MPVLARRTQRSLRGRTNILCYHHVGPPQPYYADLYPGLALERLERDIGILERGFEFAPLARLLQESGARLHLERPLIALTFDDGFDMLRNGAADVLEGHGIRATTFVITSCIGNGALMWRNKLSAIRSLVGEPCYVDRYNELVDSYKLPRIKDGESLLRSAAAWPVRSKEEFVDALWTLCGMPQLSEFLDEHRPYFTWDGLDEWIRRGHSIGLHTHTHPFCSELDASLVHVEIVEPAARLKERYALASVPFSYPFGVRLARESEAALFAKGVFSCALGIEGFAPRGTPPDRLERACAEDGFDFEVFGRAFLGLPRTSERRLRSRRQTKGADRVAHVSETIRP